jgi:hypothetical protein
MDTPAFLRSRTYRVGRVVFHEGQKGWLLVTVPVLALILPALATSSVEYRNRWTGFLLQVAGLLLVAWGIRSTRRLFGRPGLGTQLWEWYLNLLTATVSIPKHRTASISGSASIRISGHGTGTVSWGTAPRTVEEKLQDLERDIAALRTYVNEQSTALGKRLNAAEATAAEESAARQAETASLRAVLEAQSTGGLTLELIGLVWLLLGAALSSFPTELPCLLRCP